MSNKDNFKTRSNDIFNIENMYHDDEIFYDEYEQITRIQHFTNDPYTNIYVNRFGGVTLIQRSQPQTPNDPYENMYKGIDMFTDDYMKYGRD